MRLGFGEILIVLVVIVLIFGANKIPQLGDALGKGIRNFKKSSGAGGGVDDAIDVTPREPGRIAGAPPSGSSQQDRTTAGTKRS